MAILAIATGSTSLVWGQNSNTLKTTESLTHSPQTAAMMRYDDTPVQISSGRIGLAIPVAQVEDKDFDFPVSVSYNSAGFRPADPDNYVGRNWSLNYGGVIYRSIRGIPDDMEKFYMQDPQSEVEINGFMKLLNHGVFNMNTMRSDVENNPYKYAYHLNNYISQPTIPGTDKIEASPDIYYFSFGKHSGKFMMNYDGTISVVGYNGGKYVVDLSEYQMLNNAGSSSTRISIHTDDGYVYTFGGENFGSVEYTALTWDKDNDPISQGASAKPTITSWYLTQIKAPNGRTLKLHYRDIPWEYHKAPYSMMQISRSEEFREKKYALLYAQEGHSNFRTKTNEEFYNAVMGAQPNHYSFSLLKIALLDSVSTDTWNIRLHYSVREKYPKLEYLHNDSFRGARLDSVVTRYKGSSSFRENTGFEYTYTCADRMFLTSLRHSKNGKYQFKYNVDSSVGPSPMTANLDHWKFASGGSINGRIFPSLRFNDVSKSMDYVFDANDREPSGRDVEYTLLNKVTYPTGGRAEFEYEPHKYTKQYVRNARSRYIPVSENCDSRVAGGARIHSIRYFQANENEPVKEVRYKYGEEGYEGTLQYMPCYIYARYYAQDKINYDFYGCVANSDGLTAFSYPSPHIIYESVTEYYIDPKNKTTEANSPYKITSFNTEPDRYQWEFLYNAFTYPDWNPAYFTGTLGSDLANRNMFIPPSWDLSFARGKVLNEYFYDSEGELVHEVNYQYQYHQQEDYSLCIYYVNPQAYMSCGLYTHVGKEYFGTYLLDEKWTQSYTQDKIRKEFFKWDEHGYLTSQTELLSEGDSLITTYDYVFDNTSSPLKLPTDKKLYIRHKDQSPIQINSEHYVYRSVYIPLADSYRPLISEYHTGTTDVALEKRTNCLRYDNRGNPIQIEEDGVSRIYIWGYNGQYPVAKIENATYAEVTETLGGVTPESVSGEPDYNSVAWQIEGVRNKLPNAHVSTYTYKQGLGMTSYTEPSGKSTYYEYDAKGRLTQSYRMGEDGKREILQLNEYHLINE